MSSVIEPLARAYHAAVGAGQYMLAWGGKGGQVRTSVVERFDMLSTAWLDPQQFSGQSLPDGLHDMAVASDGEKAYIFGGMCGPYGSRNRYSAIYEVDLTSLDCKELIPATESASSPCARSGCGMVCFEKKLVVYGGYTDAGRANEQHLYVFDLNTNTWSTQATTGEQPPPLNGHSLTMIDQQRAVLFGGRGAHHCHNDTYVLDMEAWQWRKVKSFGQTPPARRCHAACRIAGTLTGHRPMLMVVGGTNRDVFSDVWLLDVADGSWREVMLPTGIYPRYGHSAVAFGNGPDLRVVILYGGKKSSVAGEEISWTTLLLLSPRKGSWVVSKVVDPPSLQKPDDTLREQMKGLQLYQPLSDKRAQEIIDKALETSSVKMRNLVSIITGLMGSGKTWLLCRLFNKTPPSTYTSTGIAEQSFRGLLHHMLSLHSWQQFSHKNILEFLGVHFREELPPADVVQLAAKIASPDSPQPASTTEAVPLPAPVLVSPPPTDTSQATSQDDKSATSQSIVSLVKTPNSKSSQVLSMLELVHMIDTGGQPEFMETMPNLIHNCHLALLVLNLMFGLDECPPIDYHEEGKAYKRALPSQHSNRQIIQKLACTLQSKRYSLRKGQCFRLLVIATHKDSVKGDLAARIKAFNQALEGILLPACNAELIRFSANLIPFVLNLKNPDHDDKTNLELIRTKVSDSEVGEVIDVPGCFLVFEQDLVETAKQKGRDVLSFHECLQVGAKLKMKAEVVTAALIFFHRQITFLYFQDVLPNLVFTKPQLPLDCINAVVQFSYKVNSGEVKGVTETFAASLRDGIITEEVLSHDLLSKCFIHNLYEPHHAIDLLSHTCTIAPLSREPQSKTGSNQCVQFTTAPSGRKREYLMMSLRSAISDEELPQHITAPSEIAPLVVKFTKDCVPLSCFSSTISCLLAMYDWRLSRSEDGSPECLAHNAVSLYDPQLPVQIILIDTGHNFEIRFIGSEDIDQNDYPEICFRTKDTIFTAIGQVFNIMQLAEIEVSPAFRCLCQRVSETHTASPHLFNSKWFLRCSKTKANIGAAQLMHTVWLNTPVKEKDRPSLPKLLRLGVPTGVSANYRDFGTFLLNDENGCLVDAMEIDFQGKCDRINRKILQEWLNGKGEPVTWNTLIQVLKDCKLNTLAEHVKENTQ